VCVAVICYNSALAAPSGDWEWDRQLIGHCFARCSINDRHVGGDRPGDGCCRCRCTSDDLQYHGTVHQSTVSNDSNNANFASKLTSTIAIIMLLATCTCSNLSRCALSVVRCCLLLISLPFRFSSALFCLSSTYPTSFGPSYSCSRPSSLFYSVPFNLSLLLTCSNALTHLERSSRCVSGTTAVSAWYFAWAFISIKSVLIWIQIWASQKVVD